MVFAAYHGNMDVIMVLHELLGAEAVNASDKTFGQTPIFDAVQGCRSAVVCVLCELRADVNIQNNGGTTPMYFAAQDGFVEVIRGLVELGADVNIQNNVGFTSVYLAAQKRVRRSDLCVPRIWCGSENTDPPRNDPGDFRASIRVRRDRWTVVQPLYVD